MKIQNINRTDTGPHPLKELDAHDNGKGKSVVFNRTLSTLSQEQREAHLHALVREIDEQGAKLAKKADIKEFERYRKLIREFLDDVVSNGYTFSKENTYGARGRQRTFATVKTIDQKLDELAKDVLSQQADNISIINQIDDIRGLILDMML